MDAGGALIVILGSFSAGVVVGIMIGLRRANKAVRELTNDVLRKKAGL